MCSCNCIGAFFAKVTTAVCQVLANLMGKLLGTKEFAAGALVEVV